MTPCNKKGNQSHMSGYTFGCRCPDCKAAKQANNSAYKKSPTGRAKNSAFGKSAAGRASKSKNSKTVARKASRRQYGSARSRKMKGKPEHVSLLNAIYALCPANWHVDHIVPLSKGGLHEPANLQYLTACDNQAKGAKTDYIPVTPAQRWQDWACTLI